MIWRTAVFASVYVHPPPPPWICHWESSGQDTQARSFYVKTPRLGILATAFPMADQGGGGVPKLNNINIDQNC